MPTSETPASPPLGVLLAAFLLALLGTCVLAGWALQQEPMVRIFPGSTAMAINTAAMFLAVGLGLAATCWPSRATGRVLTVIATGLVLWPALILLQHVSGLDLGIDWAAIHQRLGDGHAKPGRTAPNACIGFLLSGIVLFIARDGIPAAARVRLARGLALVVLAIGLSAFVGYLLQLELLYRVASYNQMAALTSLGMSCVGAGLLALAIGWRDTLPKRLPDGAQVTWRAAALLSTFALGAGLLAFGLLKDSYQRSAAQNLAQNAARSAAGITAVLDKTMLLDTAVASRPALAAVLARLGRDPADATSREQLRAEELTYRALGYTGIRFLGADNQELGAAGALSRVPSAVAPLGGSGVQASLLWDAGYRTRSEHEIRQAGAVVGRLVLERPLPELTAFAEAAQQVASTSDLVLCFRDGQQVACFPSRFYENAARYPMFGRDGQPALPIARALLGQQGVQSLKDPRGVAVLAAYAPVGRYPLAIVDKMETRELYVPLRDTLPLLAGMVLLLVLAGTLMLRRWVRPIVQRLVRERARAAAVLDNSIDAFVALDEQGRITHWNEQAQRLLGWAPTQALGRDGAELLGLDDADTRSARAAPRRRLQSQVRDMQGTLLPVELSVATVEGQEGLATSIFVRDLRESRERDRQLAQTREALVQAQKLDAIGKLTGGVAHD
ncbi:MAG TPA: PAS domain S-box protein, partial [Ramlibacter sp.]|nr:PAS domain S-box protein [Ramlibacter sp.]